jgi:hypothetical protein
MANWFTRRRYAWIAEMIFIYGFINRSHLQRKFGISAPQAAKDLTAFSQAHPATIRYDLSRKSYVYVHDSIRGEKGRR